MREDDLITEFRKLKWLKAVFVDGDIEDNPKRGNRNLMFTPYLEIRFDHDYREHDSTSRMRRVMGEGRIIYMRNRDNEWPIRNNLEAYMVKTAQDLLHWTIGRSEPIWNRCRQLPFTIEFWETVTKTA